jgi:transketolase
MPNMRVWRPCDTVETAIAWRDSIERLDGPTCLVLTRQGLPHQVRSADQIRDVAKGGYILSDCDGTPDLIMIATGSEVALAMDAAAEITTGGSSVRVVSMPCTDLFDSQSDEYKESVLPAAANKRIAIEAGVTEGWWRYVGPSGRVIGMSSFGASAPAEQLFEHFGFSVGNVVGVANDLLSQ